MLTTTETTIGGKHSEGRPPRAARSGESHPPDPWHRSLVGDGSAR